MANTTNFNWETPDDTDLVKDGAAAIRTLGSAIDTSLVDLKGGTTGQVLSKATNTDMDFIWVAQDDSNAIQNAIIDAKGDLIVGTAADTPARLAVGTNGHVLTADSTQTAGVKWAAAAGGGSFTKITSGSWSAVSAVNIDSIFSSTYKNYLVLIYELSSGDSPYDQTVSMQYRYSSTSATGADYYGSNWQISNSNATSTNGYTGATSITLMPDIGDSARSMCYLYVNQVGNSSQLPVFFADYYTGYNQSRGVSSGLLASAQTYTGIRLTCSVNFEGKYIVYGLEN